MASNPHVTKAPVTLAGYQAVLTPSKFGYSLSENVGEDLIDALSEERVDLLKWGQSKCKNPRRSTVKPEPWIESEDDADLYRVKFSWNAENKPTIVATEGVVITDERLPIYSGARVKLAFYQKPYVLRDGETYGTSLKLVGIQVVSLESSAGVDTGDLTEEEVSALFGSTKGFKQSTPNVVPSAPASVDEDDF